MAGALSVSLAVMLIGDSRLGLWAQKMGKYYQVLCAFLCVRVCFLPRTQSHLARLAALTIRMNKAAPRQREIPLPRASSPILAPPPYVVGEQLIPPDTVCTGHGCSIDQPFAQSALPLEGGCLF